MGNYTTLLRQYKSDGLIKVLIADDDPFMIEQLMGILNRSGDMYHILAANNGRKLCELAADQQPDIILTDWEMPEMSGVEAVLKLQSDAKTADIPIVMITGRMTAPANIKAALDTGAVDFLTKPVNEIELISRMESVLKISFYMKELRKQKAIAEHTLNYYNLQLIVKNRILAQLKTDLELHNQKEEIPAHVRAMIEKISENTESDADRQNFRKIFEAVHPLFFQHLDEKHPELNAKERNLAALLRLGPDTKELSEILGISPASVRTSVYRTGKKMKLNEDQNIRTYLKSLG